MRLDAMQCCELISKVQAVRRILAQDVFAASLQFRHNCPTPVMWPGVARITPLVDRGFRTRRQVEPGGGGSSCRPQETDASPGRGQAHEASIRLSSAIENSPCFQQHL